jgi:outer membrane protein insertion porin family
MVVKKFSTYLVKVLCAFALSLICFSTAFAYHSFVVRRIRVRGLQRIKYGTVLNYLPFSVGDKLTEADTGPIIRALYNTGFFTDVELDRRGQTLIIQVVERPTIASVSVTGNKDIPKKSFNKVLRNIGMVRGDVFMPDILEEVQSQLKASYNSRGKYNTRVDVDVKHLPRNRVAISIHVSEGAVAKIKEVRILGNHAFSDSQLLKLFVVGKRPWYSFFSKRDQYARDKLRASLEAVRSFYLDRGYLKFKIVSTQVSLSPDKKGVYITIKVHEGAQYHVSGIKLKGKFVLDQKLMRDMIDIKSGDVFSRSKTTEAINEIGAAMGNKGYGFPQIRAIPSLNDKNHTVFLTFLIEPGRRYYVRRISFSGNTKTADYVLRHGMRQSEGSLMSVSKIKESARQLRILGYLKKVDVKTKKVPGTNNQVDLDYKIKEGPSAVANAAIGYGTNGWQFNAGFKQHNFMGTGRAVGLSFMTNPYGRNYSFSYFNPFYKPNGIGRGFNLYYRKFKTNSKVDISEYNLDREGGSVVYSIPLSEGKSHLRAGYGFEHMQLNLASTSIKSGKIYYNGRSAQSQAFANQYGLGFNQIRLTAGWIYNGYDKYPFPTKGFKQAVDLLVAVPVSNRRSLRYYKLGYRAHGYLPLFHGFIFSAQGSVAYGNGYGSTNGLPFFENYFAGGVGGQGRVRGFETYNLGPKDTPLDPRNPDRFRPLGGNFLVAGTAELIMPHPLSGESYRSSVFVDAGNVYAVDIPSRFKGTSAGPIRYSAGVDLDWRSPFGPLSFSVAKPLNKQSGDDEQFFQFTVSSAF